MFAWASEMQGHDPEHGGKIEDVEPVPMEWGSEPDAVNVDPLSSVRTSSRDCHLLALLVLIVQHQLHLFHPPFQAPAQLSALNPVPCHVTSCGYCAICSISVDLHPSFSSLIQPHLAADPP